MTIIRAIGALALILSGPVWSQVQCGQYESAVDSSLKRIAMAEMEGISENSAPRATNRLIEINNEWQLINAHLSLMAQNKCPPITSLLSSVPYQIRALECRTSQLKGERNSPACDTTKWKKQF